MKVFISHSLTDQDLIKRIKDTLEPHGLQLFIAEHYEDIERTITEKIENMIKRSDVALFLLTKNGYDSHFVQQEIGYIKSQNIPYIQIIELGFENRIKGFNYGKGYILLDPAQPNITLEKVKRTLLNYWKEKKEEKRQKQAILKQNMEEEMNQIQLRQLMIKKQQEETNAKLVFGGLATLLVLGLITSK